MIAVILFHAKCLTLAASLAPQLFWEDPHFQFKPAHMKKYRQQWAHGSMASVLSVHTNQQTWQLSCKELRVRLRSNFSCAKLARMPTFDFKFTFGISKAWSGLELCGTSAGDHALAIRQESICRHKHYIHNDIPACIVQRYVL